MADLLMIVSAIAGFAPALALMFYTLNDYTYPKVEKPFFDDRKLFAFFALGIVLGMVLFAFESWGQTISRNETIVLLIVGFAAMECLMKLVILNFPRFQRKVDTAFYGLSMGLGISSTFTFASIYASAVSLETVTAVDMLAFSLLGVQLILLHGSTTAFIGVGVARGSVKPYLAEAMLIHIGYNMLMVPFFMFEVFEPPINYIGLVVATVVVVYAYVKVHRLSLPALVQDALKGRVKEPKKATKVKK
ncbi:MAG: hypothetical protein QG582_583 [Candidatus Thermoplasmatota archaeon]|nr:hypothetical protein [Candidatus Thermoplasmatota archaeon]